MYDPYAILDAYAPFDPPKEALVAADYFLERGDRRMVAAMLDRAWGLDPTDDDVARHRQAVLDELAVTERGIVFRYVPAGTFLMGSKSGDPDERPVHPVRLEGFWISVTPITWSAFCDLMGWSPPPRGMPPGAGDEGADRRWRSSIFGENKIRLQYCETSTSRAQNWHAHSPGDQWRSGGRTMTSRELFGDVERDDPSRPFEYNVKPMISVSCQAAEALAEAMTNESVRYRLPTEAEWEKAARGALIGAPYSWGHEPPSASTCDFDRFDEFSIRPPQLYPPNGYGLLSMCGGVWEWTADQYDALAYTPGPHPTQEATTARERAIRGGSWADCAEAVTVSFRASRRSQTGHYVPTIGFRLCRFEVEGTHAGTAGR